MITACFGRTARLLVIATLVVSGAAPTAAQRDAAALDTALDTAMAGFWAARTDAELATAIDAVVATEPAFDDVLDALRAGRSYEAGVATGRQLLTRSNRDGVEHPYVVYVPDTYDPGTLYPVRVYLHGGIMRPKRDDGSYWPNADPMLTRDDTIVVIPLSWPQSLWWQTSQIENLAGILNDLKRVYNVDENRVHLLGISDGATGVYYHSFKATTPWAGFLPFNGHPGVLANPTSDVDGQMYVTNLRNKPLFVINGFQDRLYPVSSIGGYIRLFLAAGLYIDFRPQDAGHNMSWWEQETPNIDAFIDGTPRRPLLDELTWETESADDFGRAHWLRIDEVAPVAGEASLEDFNTITPQARRAPLGINMLGELQNRPGLRVFDIGPNSIAEMSGMANGDVIISIDGQTTATVGDFKEAIVGFSPGDTLPVTIERDGEEQELSLDYPPDPTEGVRPAFAHIAYSGRVELERRRNAVTADTEGVSRFTLLLSPDQFDLSQPITVVTNGVTAFEGMVEADVGTLLGWAAVDQDRTMLFAAEIAVTVTPQ